MAFSRLAVDGELGGPTAGGGARPRVSYHKCTISDLGLAPGADKLPPRATDDLHFTVSDPAVRPAVLRTIRALTDYVADAYTPPRVPLRAGGFIS